MARRLTLEEAQFIEENYPKMGLDYCDSNLPNLSRDRIINKVRRLKLKLNKSLKSEICRESRKKSTITNREKELKKFNNSFSKEQTYALGLLWADGCLYKYPNRDAKALLFKVVSDDYSDFKNAISSLGSINESSVICKTIANARPQTRASIRNYGLVDWLYSIGFHKKSNTSASKLLNYISSENKNHFFRGWFDGDGCIHLPKYGANFSICGPKDYDWINWIDLFEEKNWTYTVSLKKTSSQFICTNSKILRDVFNYLYTDCDDLKLMRKYEKFKKVGLEE